MARIQAAFSPPEVSSEPKISKIGKNQINKQPKASINPSPTESTGIASAIRTQMMKKLKMAEIIFIVAVL